MRETDEFLALFVYVSQQVLDNDSECCIIKMLQRTSIIS